MGAHIRLTALYFITEFPKATIQCVESYEGSFEYLKKIQVFIIKNKKKCLVGNHNKREVVLYDNNSDSWPFGI